jgi:pimeloyl-ACP methyl ester carboxylesterase
LKPPVMLLHGMWSTGDTLTPVTHRFTDWGYSCVAPTLPHHTNGGNAQAVGNLSHLDYVDAHLRTLHEQRATSDRRWDAAPILVGHSMGGTLAQLLAARTQAAALVLFAPGVPAGAFVLRPSAVRSTIHITTKPFWWRKAHRHPTQKSANYALFNNLPPGRQEELYASLVPESGRCIFEAGMWPLDRRKALRLDPTSIRVPVLILHGTDDRIVALQGSRWLKKRYADVTLMEYTGAGHWLFEESIADQIFADVHKWLLQRHLA